jgi:hypothetical protein
MNRKNEPGYLMNRNNEPGFFMNRNNEPGFLLNFLPLRAGRPMNQQLRACLALRAPAYIVMIPNLNNRFPSIDFKYCTCLDTSITFFVSVSVLSSIQNPNDAFFLALF